MFARVCVREIARRMAGEHWHLGTVALVNRRRETRQPLCDMYDSTNAREAVTVQQASAILAESVSRACPRLCD